MFTNPNVFFLNLSSINNLPRFRVTFNLNGASGTAPHIQMISSGGKATAPANPTRPGGYSFDGWYENTAGTGTAFNFSNGINSNKTLYAKWKVTSAVDIIAKNYLPYALRNFYVSLSGKISPSTTQTFLFNWELGDLNANMSLGYPNFMGVNLDAAIGKTISNLEVCIYATCDENFPLPVTAFAYFDNGGGINGSKAIIMRNGTNEWRFSLNTGIVVPNGSRRLLTITMESN